MLETQTAMGHKNLLGPDRRFPKFPRNFLWTRAILFWKSSTFVLTNEIGFLPWTFLKMT